MPILNLILYVFAVSVLLSLVALATWDYWRWLKGKTTLSDWSLEFWRAYRTQPVIWLGIGMVVGFVMGLVSGFIAGHLVWPQTP